MADRRKICVVTGARSEYGQLSILMRMIKDDPKLRLQLVVTGMHLSPEFGLTYKAAEADGFRIDKKIETLLSSDTPAGIAKSMGLGMIGFADAFSELKPDILVILGDRFEILPAAAAALPARIPVAHLGGGASTEGAMDEGIRHAVTKMSHLHFVSCEADRRRVIQMGEDPKMVFNFGDPCVDLVKNTPPLSKAALEKALGRKLKKHNFLVTWHPATLEDESPAGQFAEILAALDKLEDSLLVFSAPNADTAGRAIIGMIEKHTSKNPGKSVFSLSYGREIYLSAMRHFTAVVGNSSSGLVEAPSFKTPSLNIGKRQEGRVKAASVIDCDPDRKSVSNALGKLFSEKFQKSLRGVRNPYGDGHSSERTLRVLRDISLAGITRKKFHIPGGNCNSRLPDPSEAGAKHWSSTL
jgi:GDP/UDP-N,N'-diacetylbacillosamine 2-epimerase (hydrolysing)